MHSIRVLAPCLVLAILASSSSVFAQAAVPQGLSSGQPGMVIPLMSLRELAEHAETIATGDVFSVKAFDSPNVNASGRNSPDLVEVSVKISETFKGNGASIVKYHGFRESLKVAVGDRVLVFLRRPSNGIVVPVGLNRGHFKISSIRGHDYLMSSDCNLALWSSVNPLWELAPRDRVQIALSADPTLSERKVSWLLSVGDKPAQEEPLPLPLVISVLRSMPKGPSRF